MTRIYDLVKRLVEKIRQLFSRERYKQPSSGFARSTSPFLQSYVSGSRQAKRIAWCKAFNRRNGFIVSEKSPISIYYKAGNR